MTTKGVAVVAKRDVVLNEMLAMYLTAVKQGDKVQESNPRTTKGLVPEDDEGVRNGSESSS